MTKKSGITRQLILSLTGAMFAFWIAAAGIGMFVIQAEIGEVFDSALQETAQRLLPLIVDDLYQRDTTTLTRKLDAGVAAAHEEYLTYQVRSAEGHLLMHSHDAPTTPFDTPLVSGFADTDDLRIYTETALNGTLYVQVAENLSHRHEAVMESGFSLLLPLVALVPANIAAIWLVVRRALRPIANLRQEIGQRDGSNMSHLQSATLPPELETIAVSVNRLLARLRAALDSEREFAAESAHALRTPIAGALAQTQRLLAELPKGPARTRAQSIEAALSDLAHLTEKLLQLARAEAGIGAAALSSDLVPIIRMIVSEFQNLPGNGERLRLAFNEDATLPREVDVDAFAISLRNLIENALRHGDHASPIVVAVTPDGTISVTSGGPAISSDKLAVLKNRFRRGVTTASGSGLGLAITDRLVGQMGGRLDLVSPLPGRIDGFEARMHLPATILVV